MKSPFLLGTVLPVIFGSLIGLSALVLLIATLAVN